MGTNDLAKDTRARILPGRAPMLPWLMKCVAAARAYGIDILDGVYNELGNAEGFAAECAQARDLGFDGKTLIHPQQIAPCNAAFSPTEEEVAWARKIIAAFDQPENAAKGVLQIDGRMVERLHADMARRTVAIADAIARRLSRTGRKPRRRNHERERALSPRFQAENASCRRLINRRTSAPRSRPSSCRPAISSRC